MAEKVTRFASRWQLTISFFIIMIALLLLGVRSQINDSHINTNTDKLRIAVYQQCMDLNTAKHGTNDVLDVLIGAVSITASIGSAEKADRIAKYRKTKDTYTDCSPLK